MQIVSLENLHEMPNPVFWEKYLIKLSSENINQHAKH